MPVVDILFAILFTFSVVLYSVQPHHISLGWSLGLFAGVFLYEIVLRFGVQKNRSVPKITSSRLVALDVVRAVAITLLLTAHITLISGLPILTAQSRWRLFWDTELGTGVSLFIILSGYALAIGYGTKQLSFWSFLYTRLRKLYPIYWVCLVISLLVYAIAATTSFDYPAAGGGPLTISSLACSITGMCAWIGQWGGPILPTSWFMGLIVGLYILFPLLNQSMRRFPHTTMGILLCLVLAFRYFSIDAFLPFRAIRWFPLMRMGEFGLGIYLAYLVPQKLLTKLDALLPLPHVFTGIAVLSFPLFLVHYPLLPLTLYLFETMHVDLFLSIGVYLVIAMGTSWLILRLTKSMVQKDTNH